MRNNQQYNQQGGPPPYGTQPPYGSAASQPQQGGYGGAPQAGFGAHQQPGHPSQAQAQGYGSAQQQGQYGAPQSGYGQVPAQQGTYPTQQQGYGQARGGQPGYGQAGGQPGYGQGPPQQQGGYPAHTQAHGGHAGYGQAQPQAGRGGMPQQQGYGSPQQTQRAPQQGGMPQQQYSSPQQAPPPGRAPPGQGGPPRAGSAAPLSVAVIKAIAGARFNGNAGLSQKGLTEVPSALWNPDEPLPGEEGNWFDQCGVRKVDLSYNKLTPLCNEICPMLDVNHLDDHKISNLHHPSPPSPSHLPHIHEGNCFDQSGVRKEGNWFDQSGVRKVDLSHNEITTLPDEIGQMLDVNHLDLSGNALTHICDGIGNMQSLKLLNLSGNKLGAGTGVPNVVGSLQSLVVLQSLPRSLGDRRAQPVLASIEAAGNNIEELPPGLSECSSITKIDLSNNRISILQPFILAGAMRQSLTELNVSKNRLSGPLPQEIGFLTSLKVLDLRENKLTAIPPSLASCRGFNAISTLPDELCQCKELLTLDLENLPLNCFNAISTLPDELGQCKELLTLDLRNNKLQQLPVGMCTLRLSLLDLTNNDLKNLPAELGNMDSLRSMPLDGPISGLMKYLKSRQDNGGMPMHGHQAARSGNVMGIDESTLAAEAARKMTISGGSHELSLKGVGLTEVPPDVWEASRVVIKLDLSNNPLVAIPTNALATFQKMTSFNLANCTLSQWPLPLFPPASLPALTELILTNNKHLQQLPPDSLAACPGLRRLDMSGLPGRVPWAAPTRHVKYVCLYTYLIATSQLPLSYLAGLPGSLPCPGVPIARQLPHSFLLYTPNLTDLDLSRTGTVHFPMEALSILTLSHLNLTDNKIEVIPDQIADLASLVELRMSNTDINSVLA
eukprot:gene3245-13267_t